jgi:subtilisin family serine protease
MMTKFALTALSLIFLSSCDTQVDDQTILTTDQYTSVNPEISKRDFIKNNNNHKVLVAIMDTGVDYNQPLLKDNIHFSLEEGKPVRTGWDLTGNDPWPAPFVARTNYFNNDLSEEEKTKSQKMLEANITLLKEFPELNYFFPIERNAEEESAEGVDHGTHVAGLASYDSPEIGILPYRVIPMNVSSGYDSFFGALDTASHTKKFTNILISGLEKAIIDGARVINMSLGITIENKDTDQNKNEFENLRTQLTNLVEANPSVFFVVAAGNDGKWIDGTSISILPCFIPRANVICVSALTKEMERSSFTNIIKNQEMTTIFAWGEKILSAFPGKSCSSKELDFSTIATNGDELKKFGEKALNICSKNQTLVEMSGTSMASPIIARKVAKLIAECPTCSVKEIKDNLFSKTINSEIDGMPIFKLPIEKPSWYSTKTLNNKNLSTPNWNFFIVRR